MDNVSCVHRRQNYTVIATEQKYWQKHYNFHTVSNDPVVCFRLALRCSLKKETFIGRIIIGESKTTVSEFMPRDMSLGIADGTVRLISLTLDIEVNFFRGLFRSISPFKQIEMKIYTKYKKRN